MRTINTTPIHKFEYAQVGNYDFTFAILEGDQYLHTPYMCKDYLQDMLWSESTGQPGSCYGLRWKPGRWDITLPRQELAIHGGNTEMAHKVPYLQEFLNHFEAAQKIEPAVVQLTTDPALVVVNFSRAWLESSPMISAFTTLIRVSGAYQGGSPAAYLTQINRPLLDPRTYVKLWDPDPGYMAVEIRRLQINLPKLFALLAGKRPTKSWSSISTMAEAHSLGIMGFFEFPVVEM